MAAIDIQHLTKDYGNNMGVFDISLQIEEGEVFGFLGPNGAGKTTTIRHLLGFIKPDSGIATILKLDCWREPKKIQGFLGYLPAEIAFPESMTGTQLIQHTANMRGLVNTEKAQQLVGMFDLDPSTPIKRMSKGMKQKVGIVCAFMHDPKILILDEPTTGLDPLMQSVFVDLIRQEKKRGKSILMSSHLFDEIEGTCDRLAMIKQGRIISVTDSESLTLRDKTAFQVRFRNIRDYQSIQLDHFVIRETQPELLQLIIEVEDIELNRLLSALSKREIESLHETKYSLEESFMTHYKGGTDLHV